MRLKNILAIVLIFVYCAEFVSAKRSMEDLLTEIEMVIEQGKNNIWGEVQSDQLIWNLPPLYGTLYVSEYYMELKGKFVLIEP